MNGESLIAEQRLGVDRYSRVIAPCGWLAVVASRAEVHILCNLVQSRSCAAPALLLRPLDARLSIGGRAADVPCEQQRPRAEITPREARGGRGRGASNDDPARNPPRSARAASATAAEPKRHVESHSGEQAARRAVRRRTAPEGCMEEMLERGRGIAARGARARAGGASSAGAPVRVGK